MNPYMKRALVVGLLWASVTYCVMPNPVGYVPIFFWYTFAGISMLCSISLIAGD
jgi:hypothetical protein